MLVLRAGHCAFKVGAQVVVLYLGIVSLLFFLSAHPPLLILI